MLGLGLVLIVGSTFMTFAELLVRYRMAGGWSRAEVADAAGVSAQYVQMLETGVRNPSADTIERFIVALDVTPRNARILRRAGNAHR